MGCGESQQSAPAPESKPVEPVAEVPSQQSAPSPEAKPVEPVDEVPAQPSSPPPEAKQIESVVEAAKPTAPPKAVAANKGADPARGIKPERQKRKVPERRARKVPDTIYRATRRGNIEAVKKHLADGADVNEKNDDGVTPLHSADTKEIAELLIA